MAQPSPRMTKADELKQFVKDEAQWESGFDVDAFRWSRMGHYPTAKFLERRLSTIKGPQTREDWRAWFEGEVKLADDPDYYRQLEREWLAKPSNFPEVIIAELPDGMIAVGDGWHRLAISIAHGRKSVPAVVGHPIARSRKTAPKRAESARARSSRLDDEISEFLTEEALHRRGLL